MTMTPFDFAVLTGLDVGGWPIPYDEDMGEWEAAWMYLLGARPPVDRVSGRVRYTWFSSHFRRAEMVPETPEETEQYARGFLIFLFGTTLFADRGNTIGLYLLSALVDLSQVRRYDWGGAGLATLYFYMSVTSRGRGDLLGGYWRAWELWVYVYFPSLAPELEVVGIPVIPYSLIFEGPHRPRPRETLPRLRQYFDTVRHSEITWQPWASLDDGLRLQYTGASDISQYRVLLEGPVARVWFLGERFLRQVWGYLSQDIPAVPPASMRTADRLSFSEVVGAMLGSDALLLVEEGDYATYRHIYLMPPLTEARIPMMRPAGMSSSGQAQAAGAPSSSRAGTSRGGSRPVPPTSPTYTHPGCPLLSIWIRCLLGLGAGSSRPSRGTGPSRPFRGARGGPVRRRRAHVVEVESDEEEEDAEATDRQFETSVEEGGSGFGSGNRGEAEEDPEDDSSDSDDGVEVVPQKRTRRTSRSRSRGL
ncbi:uncharacterized protein LOC114304687 [Camellia sinensis]|uniref:uncharacterized protein LOC114304687 n=1 Tax=Camellia sinensis TaxID=4442 RepID=UPI001036E72D|nr:uncharacterized protein LOC114304687 [Camellia sinensis]